MSNASTVGGSVIDGRQVVTTAGTRVQLSTTQTSVLEVTVTAETDNTGLIVVGGSTVVGTIATRKGTPLSAGDSYTLAVNDLTDVYLDSTVNGDGVTYSAVVA
ncbi:MAG: hypothetical protein HUU17_06220 [Chthonomonadales bacterium]|nr:hypothetical protein [Chthonomonadales bacterium]